MKHERWNNGYRKTSQKDRVAGITFSLIFVLHKYKQQGHV
jgi:hypothetical protein